ncbi:hypothetical protein TURU_127631 [Turdus rufiventris]|nr:hypothetical protein TURU_127631 [Turdus rufiventris]
MIEACTRKAELFGAPERNPGPAQAKSAAAVTPGPRKQPVPPQQLQHITCFQCKKTGHSARDCPHNQKQKKINNHKTRSTEWTVITVDLSNTSLDLTLLYLELRSRCPQPPFYLVKGQIIAQAIPVPKEITAEGKSPEVYWAEVVENTFLPLNPVMNPIQFVILLTVNSQAATWIVPQPCQNVCVTLAKTLEQENICLSMAAVENPMSTCLVGVPLKAGEYSASFEIQMPNELPESHAISLYKPRRQQTVMSKNPIEKLLPSLPKAGQEPQELKLLGSYPAQYCIHFVIFPKPSDTEEFHNIRQEFMAKRWCNILSHIAADTPSLTSPKRLPKGFFLICGDRAWAGIPSQFSGGSCTFGRLSLLAPNETLISDWTHKNKSGNKIQKRSADNLDRDSDSEIFHWAKSKRIAVSVFLPWVAAAKALGELAHLECWVVKQANLTSTAISSLLEDEQITRQVTLQTVLP